MAAAHAGAVQHVGQLPAGGLRPRGQWFGRLERIFRSSEFRDIQLEQRPSPPVTPEIRKLVANVARVASYRSTAKQCLKG